MEIVQNISNSIFDIKEKLKDEEYVKIMRQLQELSKQQGISHILHKGFCCIETNIILDNDELTELTHSIFNVFNIDIWMDKRIDQTYNDDWQNKILLKKLIEKHGSIPVQEIEKINYNYTLHRYKLLDEVDMHRNCEHDVILKETKFDFVEISPVDFP